MLTVPSLLGVLLATSLVVSAIGFRRTVWFISIGYTASIAVACLVTLLVFHDRLVLATGLHLALVFGWATRLGFFLVRRERNASYAQANAGQIGEAQALPPAKKLGIWLLVSLLYVCMVAPVVFAAGASDPGGGGAWVGLLIIALGVTLEAVADHQKSVAKRAAPRTFVRSGLYGWVRCPNYLGEILVWVGSFVAGAGAMHTWWHPVVALVGLVCIVLIMMGSTKRLERKHTERYGADPAYQQYAATVPILVPWVPVYSLRHVRVYLE